VLVLPPTSRDGELAQAALDRVRIATHVCSNVAALCDELDRGAGLALIDGARLTAQDLACLTGWLARQPVWSDLPVLLLSGKGADAATVGSAADALGNVTVLELPLRVAALVSAVRSALRGRERQYQTRENLARIEQDARDLEASTAKYRTLFETISEAVAICRMIYAEDGTPRDFRFLEVSPSFVRQTAARDAPGRTIRDFDPEIEQMLLDHCQNAIVTREAQHFELFNQRFALWLDMHVYPLADPGGDQFALVFNNIGARKRAEHELREAGRRKDEFLAILAHELRNPLAPIRNSLEILKMTAGESVSAARVSHMLERQVDYMVRLIDDLMEISRITRGKIELRREPVDVGEVVARAVEISQPQIEAGRHTIDVSLPQVPVEIDGDPVRLTQVIANLLNNAAKYTDAGGRLGIDVAREAEWVRVTVRDNGIGIAPDMLPRVFDLFAQGHGSDNRARGGLGIGLTLVKTLVELHGGAVQAKSEGLGLGSEFTFRLPLRASANAVAAKPAEMAQVTSPTGHVVVADDNRDAAESLATLLRLLGAEVDVAFNGPDALAVIQRTRPEVAFIDIGMPGMNGHEVAQRVRGDPTCSDVTLIALTGWGQESDRERSRLAGFDHHLVKPAQFQAIQAMLESAARRHAAGGA
jgi:signal transduction histidine kinase/CheY-like chemotaxis protein